MKHEQPESQTDAQSSAIILKEGSLVPL